MNNHRNQTNNLKLFRKVTVMKKLMLFVLFLVGITSLSFSQILIQTNDGLKLIVNPTITTYNSVEILPNFTRPLTATVPNATTNAWVRSIYGTANATGTAMASGYGAAGVRGLVNVTGTAAGQAYFYGTQGKFTPSATAVLAGGSWYSGLMGQMDLTAASTYTSVGCISALWLDAGASAGTAAKAAAPTMIDMAYITNTAVGFAPHSVIKAVAYATNFLSIANGDGAVGGWVTSGGTDCTASGSTDPSYTIKIDVAGTPAYIRVWSTP
jgi:hypothetical protein